MKFYEAIILSPHLDDAVFSCGGEIARLKKKGDVAVLNIFSDFSGPANQSAVLLSEERKQEDAEAAKVLGYDVYMLNEPEAYFRQKRLQSISQIFLSPQPSDLEYLLVLTEKVDHILSQFYFNRLYVPMAVGWHLDHWLVLQTILKRAKKFLNKEIEIYLYEDAPYSFIENATRLRLSNFEQNYSVFASWWPTAISFYRSGMMKNSTPRFFYYIAFPAVLFYFLRLLWQHRGQERMSFFLQSEIRDVTEH